MVSKLVSSARATLKIEFRRIRLGKKKLRMHFYSVMCFLFEVAESGREHQDSRLLVRK